jgi:hypothetical protein
MVQANSCRLGFSILQIQFNSNLFRTSDFGFRISDSGIRPVLSLLLRLVQVASRNTPFPQNQLLSCRVDGNRLKLRQQAVAD